MRRTLLLIVFAAVVLIALAWVVAFPQTPPDGVGGGPCVAGERWNRHTADPLCSAPPAATATPSPTPGPTSTPTNPGAHVYTVIYGCGYNGVNCTAIPIAAQAAWTSLAYQGADTAAYRAAGISTITYSNWNLCYPTDNPRTCFYELAPQSVCQADAAGGPGSPPEWPSYSASLCTALYSSQAAKNCSGVYVYDPHYGNGYLNAPYLNDANYAKIAQDRTGTVAQDYIFGDDTASNGGLTNGAPCNNGSTYTASLWAGQQEAAQAALTLNAPVFANVLNAYVNGLLPTDLAVIVTAPTIAGAMCENCFVKSAGALDSTTDWKNDQNALIKVQGYGKKAWVYSNVGPIAVAASPALRLYAYASFLLTFDPALSMDEYAMSGLNSAPGGTGGAVMPEMGLIPINPTLTAATVDGYAQASGVYERTFTDCFWNPNNGSNASTDIGKCKIDVNPSSTASVNVNLTGYTRAMSIPAGTANSDVYDGGIVTLTGSPGSTLAAQKAEILFP